LASSNVTLDPDTGFERGSGWITFLGRMYEPAGDYPVTFSMSDSLLQLTKTVTYHVSAEDATIVSFAGPAAVQVGTGGTASAEFTGRVQQDDDGYPGDITKAVARVCLTPIGPGSPISKVASVVADGTFSVSFAGIPVNCYSVVAEVEGGYFSSPEVEDAFTAYDAAAGYATGGGWFYWPGTQDRTNFGFVTRYGKNGANPKGSLLVIRHTAEGNYRLKSNALTGLSVAEATGSDGTYGWVTLIGKATYGELGAEPLGNYTFKLYAEDRNEPGTGIDRFWISAIKDGKPIAPLTVSPTAAGALPIGGGNIAIPHKAARVK
jgi:hypothetical protein